MAKPPQTLIFCQVAAFLERESSMAVVSLLTMQPRPTVEDQASVKFLRYVTTGETAALDELMAEHLGIAFSQARRLIGNSAEAEDAVQEAYLRLIRYAYRYDGTVPFGAWLGRAVHLAALDVMRTNRRRRRHAARAAQEIPEAASASESDEQAEAIRTAVRDLPDRYRATIDLHYFAGLSQSDTAKALGMQENAVAKRLERARDYLRSMLVRRGWAVSGAAVALALSSTPSYAAARMFTVTAVKAALLPAASGKIAIAGGAGWFGMKSAALVVLIAASLAAGVVTSAIRARSSPEVLGTWTFDRADELAGLLVEGDCHWNPNQGVDGGGCLESDSDWVLLGFPYRADELPYPICIRFRVRPLDRARGFIAFGTWIDLAEFTEFGNVGTPLVIDESRSWISGEIWMTEKSVDVCFDGQRTSLNYARPREHARLGLGLQRRFLLDDLEIVHVDSVPDVSAYIAAAESIPADQRHGEVKLPNLKQEQDKPVVMRFLIPKQTSGAPEK